MKILVTDDVHPCLLDGFSAMGHQAVWLPEISLAEVHDCIQEYDGLVVNTKIRIDKVLADKAIRLKTVARLGSGMDTIDVPYLQAKGIKVISTPEANSNAVAEHAIGMVISLLRHLKKADSEVREKIWKREENRGSELGSMRVGVVGLGHVGKKVTDLLLAFGSTVIAYDPYVTLSKKTDKFIQADHPGQLASCRLITLHVSLTTETRHLIDRGFIERMEGPFYLVNTSRGPVVDTSALLDGLQSGKIAGACLDVFENEKPSAFTPLEHQIYNRLYGFDNLVLTPHIAGWTHESKERIARSVLAQWD